MKKMSLISEKKHQPGQRKRHEFNQWTKKGRVNGKNMWLINGMINGKILKGQSIGQEILCLFCNKAENSRR